MKKLSKEEKKSRLMAHIFEDSKSWSQLEEKAKELGISKTSLSRYLNELREENIIKKVLENGNIKYVINHNEIEGNAIEFIKHLKAINSILKDEKKIISKYKEVGIFKKGINNRTLKEVTRETEHLQNFQLEEDSHELTLTELISFLLNLPYSDSVNTKIEFEKFKLKLDSNWVESIEEGIKENNKAIEKIKKEEDISISE